MGLLNIVRSGVATANQLTADLQANVTWERYRTEGGSGDESYDPPVQVPAIVSWEQKQVRTPAGELSVSRAQVIFLDPNIVVNDDDKITLPDGTTGPIIDMTGFIDRETGHPVLTEVFLG